MNTEHMTPKQVERMLKIDEMRYGDREERESTYAMVTRGWWWRGFGSGLALGFGVGLAIAIIVVLLTGS